MEMLLIYGWRISVFRTDKDPAAVTRPPFGAQAKGKGLSIVVKAQLIVPARSITERVAGGGKRGAAFSRQIARKDYQADVAVYSANPQFWGGGEPKWQHSGGVHAGRERAVPAKWTG